MLVKGAPDVEINKRIYFCSLHPSQSGSPAQNTTIAEKSTTCMFMLDCWWNLLETD